MFGPQDGALLFYGVKVVLVLMTFVVVLLGVAYMTWIERKFIAWFQNRFGPNRVGWHGLLQPIADGVKLLFKEDIVPANVHLIFYLVAPVLSMGLAFIGAAIVPLHPDIGMFGVSAIPMQIADLNVGILFFLAFSSLAVYSTVLAGWSSNSKFPLFGGIRAGAQMISYEISMGLALMGVLILAGSMSLREIVLQQDGVCYLILQPLGFIIFFIACLAETNRAPFDLPECENELVAGFHTEYSSMKFALFFLGEYAAMIVISMIIATIYLGGYQAPFNLLDGFWWLGIKTVACLVTFVWIRATFPRFRYDQLMNFGWKILLPLALLNVIVTATWVVFVGRSLMNFLVRGFNHCVALVTGLSVTFRYLVTPKMTQSYPERPGPLEPRYRGRHTQRRNEDGLERCVGCALCAIYCPAYAIYVEAAENDPENPVSPGERYASTYEIDMLRCIYCGLCEEACPEDAIQLSFQPGDENDPDDIKARYELANYEREQRFVFDKEMLLEPLTEKMKALRAKDHKKNREGVD